MRQSPLNVKTLDTWQLYVRRVAGVIVLEGFLSLANVSLELIGNAATAEGTTV